MRATMRPWMLLLVGLLAASTGACSDPRPLPDKAGPTSIHDESILMRTDDPPNAPPVVTVDHKTVPALAYQWVDNESRTPSSREPGPDVTVASLTPVTATDPLEFDVDSAVRPSMINVKFFNGTDAVSNTPSEEEGSLICSEV